MATIQLTIPDAIAPRVLDGFSAFAGYRAFVDDGEGNSIPNPQTKVQFVQQVLLASIKNGVRSYEAQVAAAAAQAKADSEVGL